MEWEGETGIALSPTSEATTRANDDAKPDNKGEETRGGNEATAMVGAQPAAVRAKAPPRPRAAATRTEVGGRREGGGSAAAV